MRKARHGRRAFWPVAIVASLLASSAWAQGVEPKSTPARDPDLFISWHQSLSNAADRTLAVTLADKPWMRNPETTTAAAGRTSDLDRDPVMRLHAAIRRVQQLRVTIDPILRQEGVPIELSAIVLVESGGQPTALSPKGARGLWQLIPDTARRYGLTVSPERDERINIVKSTQAAARYLRDLYLQFGDWQLAFAAYNAGEQAVGQAIGRTGQRGFVAIQRALPQETRDYVPAVLNAVAVIGGKPERLAHTLGSVVQNNSQWIYASPGGSN